MKKILVNGKYTDQVSIFDRGLHYGDGIFETIRISKARPVMWEDHMERLYYGCEKLFIDPPSSDVLAREANELIKDTENAVLKIIITRGQGGRGYVVPQDANTTRILLKYPLPNYSLKYYTDGVWVRICKTRLSSRPELAGIKHLNRLEQVLARNEWQEEEIAEGLMLNSIGDIVEGTMSNVFLVVGKRLITPPLEDCGIAGIMRAHVLKLAQDLGISHDISKVDEDQLFAANEVFLTNSVIGIWPVKKIQHKEYKIGPMTQKLMELLIATGILEKGIEATGSKQ